MLIISTSDNNPVDTNVISLAGLGPEQGIAFVEETLEKLLLTPGHGFTELHVTLAGKKLALIKTSMANMLDKYVCMTSCTCRGVLTCPFTGTTSITRSNSRRPSSSNFPCHEIDLPLVGLAYHISLMSRFLPNPYACRRCLRQCLYPQLAFSCSAVSLYLYS